MKYKHFKQALLFKVGSVKYIIFYINMKQKAKQTATKALYLFYFK